MPENYFRYIAHVYSSNFPFNFRRALHAKQQFEWKSTLRDWKPDRFEYVYTHCGMIDFCSTRILILPLIDYIWLGDNNISGNIPSEFGLLTALCKYKHFFTYSDSLKSPSYAISNLNLCCRCCP